MFRDVALITGVTGQDGSYLAELLLSKGWAVHGLVRRTSTSNLERIKHLKGLELHEGDVTDLSSVITAMKEADPYVVYNLAAQSYVGTSWRQPFATYDITGRGAANVIEAFRSVLGTNGKLFQASSSEMFGTLSSCKEYQTENTPFHPRSPYGVAKVFAHHVATNYRESYDLNIFNGIMFNHESPRRGVEFVTRKIARAAARIKLGHKEHLMLGNIEACRDWGYAGDFAVAMYLLTTENGPSCGDYVIATGETHSVKEFAEKAFQHVGLSWIDHTGMAAHLHRPAEIRELVGDATKLTQRTGWRPTHRFNDLVELMVNAELQAPENREGLP
jgi:GDPmannose 4,6-dehydratase